MNLSEGLTKPTFGRLDRSVRDDRIRAGEPPVGFELWLHLLEMNRLHNIPRHAISENSETLLLEADLIKDYRQEY